MDTLSSVAFGDMVVTSGFVAGFIWSVDKPKDFVEYPLSNLLYSSIGGAITSIGASIVSMFIPDSMKPIIPICLGFSSIYHIHKICKNDHKKSAPWLKISYRNRQR